MAYKKETRNIEKKDFELKEGQRLKTMVAHSPKLPNWNHTHGGPVYLGVGGNLLINTTNYTVDTTESENGTNI